MRNKTVFGLSMEKRSHRRRLVVAAYTLLAILVAGGWMLDRFQDTGIYIYFAAFFINYYVFGGYGPYGLVRPFTGKAPRQAMPGSLVEVQLSLAGIRTAPDTSDSRNDGAKCNCATASTIRRISGSARCWPSSGLSPCGRITGRTTLPPPFSRCCSISSCCR